MCKTKKEMAEMLPTTMPRQMRTDIMKTWKRCDDRQFNQLRRERKLKECVIGDFIKAVRYLPLINLHDRTIMLEELLADKGLKIVKMTKSENTAHRQRKMKNVKDNRRILCGVSEAIRRDEMSLRILSI